MRTDREPRRRPGRSFIGATVAVAAAAILATACGTAPAPGAPARPTTGVALDRTHRGAPASSRAGAIAYGRELLASLRLPAGARKLSWPVRVPAGLDPTRPAILSDVVDVKALYRFSTSMSATYRFLLDHPPAGTMAGAYGQGSQSGTVTSQFADFTAAHPPGSIFSADVNTVIEPAAGGGSLLRADAFVAWYPPRGSARPINPADYTAVIVRWQHGYSVTTRTLASRQAVARFTGLYNALHGAPDTVTNCPGVMLGAGRNDYQILFSPAHGQPRVVVSPTTCMFVEVSIGGRPVSALYPATALLSSAARAVR